MAIKFTGKETFLGKVEVNKEPFTIGDEKEPQKTSIPDSLPNLDHILNLRLSELSRHNIAIKPK